MDHVERARRALESVPAYDRRGLDVLAAVVALAIGDAVAVEREACARVADEYRELSGAASGRAVAEAIARRIRARRD